MDIEYTSELEELQEREHNTVDIISIIFIFFCLCPFLFPLPFMTTNLQPYATVFGLLVIFINLNKTFDALIRQWSFLTLFITFIASILVFLFGNIDYQALRGLFNHVSVFIVPLAVFVMLQRIGHIPEKIIKLVILFWFFTASVQFFIYRGFLTNFIGEPNWSSGVRGVVGLASEPSFLGIACFYFLQMAQKFTKNRLLFIILITAMGTLYAQSFMGIVFIAVWYVLFWLEHANSKQGAIIFWSAIGVAVVGWFVLSNFASSTRLYQLINKMLTEGISDTITGDASANTRYNALINAFTESFSGWLMPNGYQRRIGSGFGGLIIETGIFGLFECIVVVAGIVRSYNKGITRFVGFILVTILLFMNTQIGNPLLLFVIGTNIWEGRRQYDEEEVVEQ